MVKYDKLRISYECMNGQHHGCQGYDNTRTGRHYRCQCAHHTPTPKPTLPVKRRN
jgi:hypothetical protein